LERGRNTGIVVSPATEEHAMSLTFGPGPLARKPASANYEIDGPVHRIYFHPFGRRVRLELAGETLVDTLDAQLLHETGILPRLYVPLSDIRADVLRPSDTTSHCPFKGDATYRSVEVGGTVSEDAFWLYEQPLPAAPWLAGYAGVYEERFDRLLDEDEEVVGGHLRDPFHRVDVRRTSRHVRVTGPDGAVLADSTRPLLVAETGVRNRFYLPREDVQADLEESDTPTACPYKGVGTYWHVAGLKDAAWSYERPLDGATPIAGYVSFDGDGIEVTEVR
jgi:uncharacterized protein (DUF427 family)